MVSGENGYRGLAIGTAGFYHSFSPFVRRGNCSKKAMAFTEILHPDCRVEHNGRYVHAYVGPRHLDDVQECYRHIASLAAEHKYSRILIVGDEAHDPISHLAARDVVIALAVIGVPAGFRLALVPRAHGPLNGYRHAEIEAKQRGLRVRVFDNEEEATRWLTAPEVH